MNLKTILVIFLTLAAGILIGGVGQVRYGLLGDSHTASVDDGHAHGGDNARQVTIWGDRFEIFLEHAPIVAGTPTEFVTHISDLATFEPRRSGAVTFVLSGSSHSPVKHVEPKPARDGIYIPELNFPSAGQWQVSLVIPLKGVEHIVDLGDFEVYASKAQAESAPPAEDVEGISFLKEQQWELKTRTKVVAMQQIGGVSTLAIPESAVIDEGAEHIAFVHVAGETFEERFLTLGVRADGFVEVVSGLSQGERVVTDDPHAIDATLHEGEQVVHLSDEDVERYGIEIGTAGPGEIDVHVQLPGQIAVNSDRIAHIVPTAPGVVRSVLKNVGDKVKAGDILAWIESTELGKAKVEYLTKWAELGCCAMDLTRTRQIHESTLKLLDNLESKPSLDALDQISGAALDKNHTTLVSSYAELVLGKSAYQREKKLYDAKISSEKDFLAAENEFKKAEAKYAASRDSITFQIQKNLIDAERDQRVREIGLKGAERSLYVLGLTAEDVNEIRSLGQGSSADEEEEVCTTPNCAECAARAAKKENARLAWYPLRAPFGGTVIYKHITLGEKLSDESNVFTVADLSTVWVNLNVHQKDLPMIKAGQHVRITAGAVAGKVQGAISYVSPVVGESSRTTLARVVLDNTSGVLRPGTFVTADVVVDQTAVEVSVPKDILQDIDDSAVVFVRTGHGFELRTVTLGRRNTTSVEIAEGLKAGDKIVTKNSFRLKAELEKDAGGGHAGHGHAH